MATGTRLVSTGRTALAAHSSAVGVLALAHRALAERGWRLAPVVVALQSRVALGDEIGELLHAGQVAILIGERPGLSSADSLGIYLTFAPQPAGTVAEPKSATRKRAKPGEEPPEPILFSGNTGFRVGGRRSTSATWMWIPWTAITSFTWRSISGR